MVHFKKGALEGEYPLILIIAIVTLLLIGGIILAVYGEDDLFENLVCKTSVVMADQVNSATLNVFPIICYTQDKVSVVSKKEDVMWEITNSMKKCWSMWGEGELDAEGENLFVDDFNCFKCFRLEFSDFDEDISEREFKDFLEKNEINGDTYLNYFNNNVVFKTDVVKGEKYTVAFVEHVDGFGASLRALFGGFKERDGIIFSKYEDTGFCTGYIT